MPAGPFLSLGGPFAIGLEPALRPASAKSSPHGRGLFPAPHGFAGPKRPVAFPTRAVGPACDAGRPFFAIGVEPALRPVSSKPRRRGRGLPLRPAASQDPGGLWLSPQGQEDRHAMQAGPFLQSGVKPALRPASAKSSRRGRGLFPAPHGFAGPKRPVAFPARAGGPACDAGRPFFAIGGETGPPAGFRQAPPPRKGAFPCVPRLRRTQAACGFPRKGRRTGMRCSRPSFFAIALGPEG